MRNTEIRYCVLAYTEPKDERLVIAEDKTHSQAWEIARQAMNDNPNIYAVSVKTQAFLSDTEAKITRIEAHRLAKAGGDDE